MNYDPDTIPANELGRGNLFRIDATKPAGFWLRVGAYLLDMLLMVPLLIMAHLIPGLMAYSALIFLGMVYKPMMEGAVGATLGKMAVGVRVINAGGSAVGVPTAFLRNILFILPALANLILGLRLKEAGFNPLSLDRTEEVGGIIDQYQTVAYVGNVLYVICLVAVIWVAFHPRKRGLHDLLAQSYVIEKGR